MTNGSTKVIWRTCDYQAIKASITSTREYKSFLFQISTIMPGIGHQADQRGQGGQASQGGMGDQGGK